MQQLLDDLHSGKTVITVNNRLARDMQTRYDLWQHGKGLQIWPSAQILPWSAWLKLQYEQLLDNGHTEQSLLNSHQELCLWENIIRRSDKGQQLLRPAAAAKTVQQAHGLILEWLINLNDLKNDNPQTTLLIEWIGKFQKECKLRNKITQAELPALIEHAISSNQLTISDDIVLSGFDDHSPVRKSLIETIGSKVKVSEFQRSRQATKTKTIAVNDLESEIRLAANWAKKRTNDFPGQIIAIVSPQLQTHRNAIERIFTEVLQPTLLLQPPKNAPSAFNISMGRKLSDYAMVHDALLALRLCQHPLPLNEIGRLLRSPFLFSGNAQREQQGLFDLKLRKLGYPKLDRRKILQLSTRIADESGQRCEGLNQSLSAIEEIIQMLPKEASPTQWSGHFLNLFEAMNWPGDASLDSHEFQLAERFRNTISEFSLLSQVQSSMTYGQALNRLTQLIDDSVFQPKSNSSPIQVLGILEAGGLSFDAIWMLGMDDQQWPPTPSPNPLLPTRLQRQQNMPHASAERELSFAKQLLEHLMASSKEIIASFAEQTDNKEVGLSPLLKNWHSCTEKELKLVETKDELRTACKTSLAHLYLPEAKASQPTDSLRGGAHLIAAQSECPFKAVAKYRLLAESLPEAITTPDARMQGSLVHDILQNIWQQIGDSERLQTATEEALMGIIDSSVNNALAGAAHLRPDLYSPSFTELEKDRLNDLMLSWLSLEKQRETPFKISQLETDKIVDINGLKLKLRADRIDKLENGKLAVIDYKTGAKANINAWFDERIKEPQVPLYCLDTKTPVAAALLAKVRSDRMEFKGLSENQDIVPKIKTFEGYDDIEDWPSLMTHWQRQITALANEILKGVAKTTPSEQACEYCELGGLCRDSAYMDGGNHG